MINETVNTKGIILERIEEYKNCECLRKYMFLITNRKVLVKLKNETPGMNTKDCILNNDYHDFKFQQRHRTVTIDGMLQKVLNFMNN